MLTKYHIRLLIEGCRELSWIGLDNGTKASIPELEIDILVPPNDFLGVKGNPAIFINENTFRLLGALHEDWVLNKTIALKENFLLKPPMEIIGAILHETGHAFNVAAQIENTEGNAYVFEIEIIRKLLEEKSPLLFGCTGGDVKAYFENRLPFYKKAIHSNQYLAKLVDEIQQVQLNDRGVQNPRAGQGWMLFFINSLGNERSVMRPSSPNHSSSA